MNTQADLGNTLKHPSAFLPVMMSLFALAVVLTHIAFFGTARQPDEGTAALLWQLLMAGQLPIVAFFAFRWLPQVPVMRYWFSRCKQLLQSQRLHLFTFSIGEQRG